MCLLYLP